MLVLGSDCNDPPGYHPSDRVGQPYDYRALLAMSSWRSVLRAVNDQLQRKEPLPPTSSYSFRLMKSALLATNRAHLYVVDGTSMSLSLALEVQRAEWRTGPLPT